MVHCHKSRFKVITNTYIDLVYSAGDARQDLYLEWEERRWQPYHQIEPMSFKILFRIMHEATIQEMAKEYIRNID